MESQKQMGRLMHRLKQVRNMVPTPSVIDEYRKVKHRIYRTYDNNKRQLPCNVAIRSSCMMAIGIPPIFTQKSQTEGKVIG